MELGASDNKNKYKACRICMEASEVFVSLFDEIHNSNIALMITAITGLEVKQNDGLPQNSCLKCAEEMYTAHFLRIKCLNTDAEIRKLIIELRAESTQTLNVQASIDDDIKLDGNDVVNLKEVQDVHENTDNEHEEESYERDCAENSSERETKTRPKRNVKSKNRKLLQKCCGCDHTFENEKQLKAHSTTVHEPEVEHEDKPNNQCDICFRAFANKSVLRKHKRISVKKYQDPFVEGTKCCGCYMDLKTIELLKKHSEEIHSVEKTMLLDKHKKLQCEICFKRFLSKSSLDRHQKFVYERRQIFNCSFCDRKFNRKHSKIAHEKRHLGAGKPKVHEDKRYECDECHKLFTEKSNLRNHKKLHLGIKPFQCDICQKFFGKKSNLGIHLIHVHMETVTMHPCYLCTKQFKTKDSLKSHIDSHNPKKIHECHICQVKFRTSSYLKQHIRTHTGEQPYQCEICSRKFTHYNGYKLHQLTHEEKKFVCNFCQKRFGSRRTLVIHEKFHTGELNYPCDVCEKKFVSHIYLQKHRRSHFK